MAFQRIYRNDASWQAGWSCGSCLRTVRFVEMTFNDHKETAVTHEDGSAICDESRHPCWDSASAEILR